MSLPHYLHSIRTTIAALAVLTAAAPAHAQVTIAVNNTAQEVTLDQPAGLTNGNCTLGEAILAANARGVRDGCNGSSVPGTMVTLDLLPGNYTFDRVGQNAPTFGAGSPLTPLALPALTQHTTISGNNAVLRRLSTPGTPPMGLLAVAADGLVLRIASLRLEGGVRGLSIASSPAGSIATLGSGVSLSEFRLTDVVIANPLGTPFSVVVTTLARLERVTMVGADLRTTRAQLSTTGSGAATVEVIDSEFADGRGGLSISAGGQHVSASVLVSRSRFLRNRGPIGAGLRINSFQPGLQVNLQDNQFIDNTGSSGGGLEIQLGSDGAPAMVMSSGNLFRGNVATGNGGGLRITGGGPLGYRFRSSGDTFERNAATEGGALRIDGNLAEPALIERAIFRDNAADIAAAVAFAGNHVALPRTALRITRSSFSGNADVAGTVLLVGILGIGHRVQFDNSTIDGNFANARLVLGGNGDSVLDVEALTITRNSARFAVESLNGGASLRNTVIAGNFLVSACNILAGSTITNAGGLFVQDATCLSPARSEDPLLGPMAANGGTTPSRVPLFGSPLLNAGVAPVLETQVDQRGVQRVLFGATDIGAVESDSPVIFVSGFEPGN